MHDKELYYEIAEIALRNEVSICEVFESYIEQNVRNQQAEA